MNLTQEEIQRISPYQEVTPVPQNCTHCGSYTSPRIINKQTSVPTLTIQEAHWICGRCNNRFRIGRVRR